MKKIRYWITYSLLGIFFIPAVVFFSYNFLYPDKSTSPELNKAALGEGVSEVPVETKKKKNFTESDPWQEIYPDTKKMLIGEKEVNVSIAKTWPERIQGLSGTPYLPEEVVKLFVFETAGLHSIWMKDMMYAIDILWTDKEGKITHIVENATPESYPEMFEPTSPAYYVIETKSGFTKRNFIKVGSEVVFPDFD